MVALVFDAQLFASQALPEPLPEISTPNPAMQWPADCKLTEEQRSMLGMGSNLVGGTLDTPAKVMQHWTILDGLRADTAARVAAAQARDPVVKQEKRVARGHKEQQIETARLAWKAAVKERKLALLKMDAHVKALHEAYNAACAL